MFIGLQVEYLRHVRAKDEPDQAGSSTASGPGVYRWLGSVSGCTLAFSLLGCSLDPVRLCVGDCSTAVTSISTGSFEDDSGLSEFTTVTSSTTDPTFDGSTSSVTTDTDSGLAESETVDGGDTQADDIFGIEMIGRIDDSCDNALINHGEFCIDPRRPFILESLEIAGSAWQTASPRAGDLLPASGQLAYRGTELAMLLPPDEPGYATLALDWSHEGSIDVVVDYWQPDWTGPLELGRPARFHENDRDALPILSATTAHIHQIAHDSDWAGAVPIGDVSSVLHSAAPELVDVDGDGLRDLASLSKHDAHARILWARAGAKHSLTQQFVVIDRPELAMDGLDANYAWGQFSAHPAIGAIQWHPSSTQIVLVTEVGLDRHQSHTFDLVSELPGPALAIVDIRVEDFDRDGIDDLLVSHVSAGEHRLAAIAVLGDTQNPGVVQLGNASVLSHPEVDRVQAIDFDTDGDLDLIVATQDAHTLGVIETVGSSQLVRLDWRLHHASRAFTHTVTGDFNGDGAADLVVVLDLDADDQNDDAVALLLANWP